MPLKDLALSWSSTGAQPLPRLYGVAMNALSFYDLWQFWNSEAYLALKILGTIQIYNVVTLQQWRVKNTKREGGRQTCFIIIYAIISNFLFLVVWGLSFKASHLPAAPYHLSHTPNPLFCCSF
jgi:hypothetical protein